MNKDYSQLAIRVTGRTILVNILLSAVKMAAGLIGRSGAMVSDAIHSLSDVLSSLVVILGIRMAHQDSDKEHPYGHERFECVAAIILSVLLFITGIGIGWNGVQKILSDSPGSLEIPHTMALAAAILSILIKEGMYWYTRAAAKKIGSSALMADAWHHRSDALSSIGSFAGILGARLGYPILDPIACVVICIFIVKASIDIFREATCKMTDHACDDTILEELEEVILKQPGVLEIDLLQTRLFGDKFYVDVEISADGHVPLTEAHFIAHQVHDAIEQDFPLVKHCMVHVNPRQED